MDIFQRRESEVRSYCRSFPVLFSGAKGSFLFDEQGNRYLDFLSGAGSLNYGHNNPAIKQAVIEYLQGDNILHSLDLSTVAKKRFLERFSSVVLEPRGMDYKVQFTGPTGANAVEAALKLARLVKRRSNVIAFTNGYHGLSSGALAVTGNSFYRSEAFIHRNNVSFLPFDGYFGGDVDTVAYLRRFLGDSGSGVDLPAAVILETIQAEGGVNVASLLWLRDMAALCKEFDILLIVDDIQVGNGRTGSFFSFEEAGIAPDMIVLSKSIGGIGLPIALVLLKPEHDVWKPGEHTGTFRGNNLAFVAATEALSYWENAALAQEVRRKGLLLRDRLEDIRAGNPALITGVRGKGLIYGLEFAAEAVCKAVSGEAFARQLVIERCGPKDNVLKFLPPLTIAEEDLLHGVAVVAESVASVGVKSAS
ncbi:MAG: diaminobutyrate--2-oxoglutarate transaminase [Sulfuricella sp.]|nr:diaminobutyrate--2-oxoglutarate transaminase [Sulfuricella sp.]